MPGRWPRRWNRWAIRSTTSRTRKAGMAPESPVTSARSQSRSPTSICGSSSGSESRQQPRHCLTRPTLPMKHILTTAVVCLFLSGTALAQTQGEYRVSRTAVPPKIDGVLDDTAWESVTPMPTGQWKSYNPNRGDAMPDIYRTEVRVSYDDRNIYFAFHCFDNEP